MGVYGSHSEMFSLRYCEREFQKNGWDRSRVISCVDSSTQPTRLKVAFGGFCSYELHLNHGIPRSSLYGHAGWRGGPVSAARSCFDAWKSAGGDFVSTPRIVASYSVHFPRPFQGMCSLHVSVWWMVRQGQQRWNFWS